MDRKTIRKVIKSILCLFILAQCVFAQDAQSIFADANTAYQNGKFQKALEKYNELLDQGNMSTELYYNLGNTNFKLKQYVKSILYYEKGLKLDPNNKSILTNLELANDEIDSDIVAIPPFLLFQWWQKFTDLFSLSMWSILQALTFIIIAALLVLLFLKTEKRIRRNLIFSLIGVSLLFLIISFATFTKGKQMGSSNNAIVMDYAILNEGPDIRSDTLTNIQAGIKVKLNDKIGEWHKVTLSNQLTGWIELSKLERI